MLQVSKKQGDLLLQEGDTEVLKAELQKHLGFSWENNIIYNEKSKGRKSVNETDLTIS